MKLLTIGKIKLKNPLILAPMLDVTNLPYRLLCRKAGAALCFTEMLYTNQILNENKKTLYMMKTCKEDKPLGIQVTGSNIDEFKKAIPYLKKYDIVDLNCGCPSTRILGTQAGSYLMKEPKKIASVVRILKDAGLTVCVKLRLGVMKNNVLEIAKLVEEAGGDAITVHARLSNQPYSIPADWKWISKVKKAVKIPVIGNGDVFSGKDAEKMLKICDGVMIGRGSIGDPLIFERILKYLKTGKEPEFNFEKNLEAFKEYIKITKKYGIEDLQKIKYTGINFIRRIRGAAKLRNEFMQLKDSGEILRFSNSLLSHKSLYTL